MNHPTPRTDAVTVDWVTDYGMVPLERGDWVSADHARKLEQELAELRSRQADSYQSAAKGIAPVFPALAKKYRAVASHLRDLSQPLDPSKL